MLIELALRRTENDDHSCEGHLSNLILSTDVDPPLNVVLKVEKNTGYLCDRPVRRDRWHCYLETLSTDRLCGLVVRISGYRSRGPWFDSRRFHIFWEAAGLERGPLSLMKITEELLQGKSSGSGLENRD
jgi:hypothetical protein